MTEDKAPQTIDDLADEAVQGFQSVLSPRTYKAIHGLRGIQQRLTA